MNKIKVLSIDGGGIRGVIPATILSCFESDLKAIHPNQSINDFFDLMVGTSTGGILATLFRFNSFGSRKLSATEILDLYLELGKEVFQKTWKRQFTTLSGIIEEKYNDKHLVSYLDDLFGDARLSDLNKPLSVTAYDIRSKKAHFFRTFGKEDFYLKDVVRATTAAPSYFEPIRVSNGSGINYDLIDGGVFAGNPSMVAYSEIRGVDQSVFGIDRPQAQDLQFLSIGCGYDNSPIDINEAQGWGKAQWIQPLIDIMLSSSSETMDFHLKQIFEGAGVADQYVRLQGELLSIGKSLDDSSDEYLTALRGLGEKIYADNRQTILRLFDLESNEMV